MGNSQVVSEEGTDEEDVKEEDEEEIDEEDAEDSSEKDAISPRHNLPQTLQGAKKRVSTKFDFFRMEISSSSFLPGFDEKSETRKKGNKKVLQTEEEEKEEGEEEKEENEN